MQVIFCVAIHVHSTTGKSTKTHLYWAMKTCDGTGDDLQRWIMNIIQHYQVCIRMHITFIHVHVFLITAISLVLFNDTCMVPLKGWGNVFLFPV